MKHATAVASRLHGDSSSSVVVAPSEDLLRAAARARAPIGGAGEWREFLQETARIDPMLALHVAQTFCGGESELHDWLAMIVRAWAGEDPARAWTWAIGPGRQLDRADETPLFAAALDQIAAAQPATVIDLIDRACADEAEGPTHRAWTDAVVTAGVAALLKADELAYAAALLSSSGRVDASAESASGPLPFEMVASEWARRAPAEAAAWLDALPPSEGRARGLAAIAAGWAETSPSEAIAWAVQLAPVDGRDRAVAVAFERWMHEDAVTAVRWLAAHESRPAADRQIAKMLSSPATVDASPSLAANWAAQIENGALRQEVLKRALRAWVQRDRDGAAEFVAHAVALTAAQRDELAQMLAR